MCCLSSKKNSFCFKILRINQRFNYFLRPELEIFYFDNHYSFDFSTAYIEYRRRKSSNFQIEKDKQSKRIRVFTRTTTELLSRQMMSINDEPASSFIELDTQKLMQTCKVSSFYVENQKLLKRKIFLNICFRFKAKVLFSFNALLRFSHFL